MSTEQITGEQDGTGRTIKGLQWAVDRLATGATGVIASPSMAHLRRIVWPALKAMLNPKDVSESQRYRFDDPWGPTTSFRMNFTNGAVLWLVCDPEQTRGLNYNFAFVDRLRDPVHLKMAQGGARVAGPQGQEAAVWWTEGDA